MSLIFSLVFGLCVIGVLMVLDSLVSGFAVMIVIGIAASGLALIDRWRGVRRDHRNPSNALNQEEDS